MYLPLSKSIAQRILVMQAMAGVPVGIPANLSLSEDVLLLQEALKHGSINLPSTYHVPTITYPFPIHVGANGTAYRLLTAYFWGQEVQFTGTERLLSRPIEPLKEALRALDSGESDIWVDNRQSSQFVTALLLVAPRYGRDLCFRLKDSKQSRSYIHLTIALMQQWGISIDEAEDHIVVHKGSYQPPQQDLFELDWSAAAVWYEWQAIHKGLLDLSGLNPDSLQGDRKIVDYIEQLSAQPKLWQANMHDTPDLVPYLVVTACVLGVPFCLTGVRTLQLKESDRLTALKQELLKKGFLLRVEEDSITWEGEKTTDSIEENAILSAHDDHRLAMAFAAAGWKVDNPDCVGKSYPAFWDDLAAINKLTRLVPDDYEHGKKYALRQGMLALPSEYVWCSDADASHLPECESALRETLQQEPCDLLLLPVCINQDDSQTPRWWAEMQRVELLSLVAVSIRTAQKGRPTLCNGAGLVVRRKEWLNSWSDLRPEIPSGDDVYLLHSFKKRGLSIRYSTDPRTLITVPSCPDLRTFFRQRCRWAGKSGTYTDRDTNRLGILVALLCVLQLLFPPFVLLKWPVDYFLLRSFRHLIPCRRLALWSFVWDLFYPLYALTCLIGGLVSRRRHPNRW